LDFSAIFPSRPQRPKGLGHEIRSILLGLRRWVNDPRRRIAVALHLPSGVKLWKSGDELGPLAGNVGGTPGNDVVTVPALDDKPNCGGGGALPRP
jgi:hypothetical protein